MTDVERPRIEQTEMSGLWQVEIARLWGAFGKRKAEADVESGTAGPEAA